jgi:hypothetical protein
VLLQVWQKVELVITEMVVAAPDHIQVEVAELQPHRELVLLVKSDTFQLVSPVPVEHRA